MKTIVTLLVLFCASLAHAQDPMAKWKPSLEDKFVYLEEGWDTTYWHNLYWSGSAGKDTITYMIISVDTNYDTMHHHVLVVKHWNAELSDSGLEFYYFGVGRDSMSSHSFQINRGYDQSVTRYDFSVATQEEASFGSHIITLYRFVDVAPLSSISRYDSSIVTYSPELHWFYSKRWVHVEPFGGYSTDGFSSSILLSSNTLGVNETQELAENFSVVSVGKLLRITSHCTRQQSATLLDPLGRPIRSWQLAAGDGPREITLNVADVPSGVYFLRLQGSGVDEVKRVAITH